MPLLLQMLCSWYSPSLAHARASQVQPEAPPCDYSYPTEPRTLRALGYLWHPIDGGNWALFSKLEPSLRRIPRDDTPAGLVTRLGAHDHSHIGLTPLDKLSLGEGILATVNSPEHSALSLMGYLGRRRVCALPRASRENRDLQRVLVA